MSVTLVKVNCVTCNNAFETAFQGKHPKCKNCIQHKEPVIITTKEPVTLNKTVNISVDNRKKLVCVNCKIEFISGFLGKNPKCGECTKKKENEAVPTANTNTNTNTEPIKKTESDKKMVTCGGCKVVFPSTFQGKNPKCVNCK